MITMSKRARILELIWASTVIVMVVLSYLWK
jgi:hypothetical protein